MGCWVWSPRSELGKSGVVERETGWERKQKQSERESGRDKGANIPVLEIGSGLRIHPSQASWWEEGEEGSPDPDGRAVGMSPESR